VEQEDEECTDCGEGQWDMEFEKSVSLALNVTKVILY